MKKIILTAILEAGLISNAYSQLMDSERKNIENFISNNESETIIKIRNPNEITKYDINYLSKNQIVVEFGKIKDYEGKASHNAVILYKNPQKIYNDISSKIRISLEKEIDDFKKSDYEELYFPITFIPQIYGLEGYCDLFEKIFNLDKEGIKVMIGTKDGEKKGKLYFIFKKPKHTC